jgi:hypothetical protein
MKDMKDNRTPRGIYDSAWRKGIRRESMDPHVEIIWILGKVAAVAVLVSIVLLLASRI